MLQTGIELIGSDTVAAVAEVLRVALDALEAAGVRNVSVDLTLPNLVEAPAAGPMALAADKVPEPQACLDGKDAAGLERKSTRLNSRPSCAACLRLPSCKKKKTGSIRQVEA